MRKTPWVLSGAGIALLLLAACGQKGPLYLPDKKGSVVKPVTASPEARAQRRALELEAEHALDA